MLHKKPQLHSLTSFSDGLWFPLLTFHVKWLLYPFRYIFYPTQVYSIRDAAANNLKRLAEEFGPEWAMQHIVPQV